MVSNYIPYKTMDVRTNPSHAPSLSMLVKGARAFFLQITRMTFEIWRDSTSGHIKYSNVTLLSVIVQSS